MSSQTHTLRRSPQRSGVILLVILIVLTLFTLVTLTFVIVARQHRGSARAAMKQDRYDVGHQDLLLGACLQVLRGTANPGSALFQPHDLLSDMYGNDAFPPLSNTTPATIANVLNVDPSDNTTFYRYDFFEFTCSHGGLAPEDGHYNGRVLTMLDGDQAGESTRIVGYSYNSSSSVGRFQVLKFTRNAAPVVGDRFIINGGAFNGLGFGFNGNGQTAGSFALQPNNLGNVLGGPDEDYDIPDYNNLLLAGRIWNAGQSRWETRIPSLYRPALLNYWANQSSPPNIRNLVLHAFQPGSLNLDANGDGQITLNELQLDVDTDGDGLLDSIWVDLGYPVQTSDSGELYKPLFAMQVIDLDGRLSLNAHGCFAHTAGITASQTGDFAGGGGPNVPVNLPVGQGYGPGDVALRQLFASDASYNNLLNGNGNWSGRYGTSGVAGKSGVDWLVWFRMNDYVNFASSYASPPDMDADGQMGLDKYGQPLYNRMGEANDRDDHPYENNPSKINGTDYPFHWSELEPLLRPFDIDSSTLPQRLVALTNNENSSAKFRGQVTTTSHDLPSPSVLPTSEMRYGNNATNLSFEDMLRQRLELSSQVDYAGNPTDSNGADDDGDSMTDEANEAFSLNADLSVATMIPPDLGTGVRFDINKPFGNGQDSNSNNIVDEYTESTGNPAWPSAGSASAAFSNFSGVNFQTAAGLTRYDYAKHLYLLAMLAKDREYRYVNTGSLSNEQEHKLTAIRLAQWAINVVDFRDRDSIMTPFEFDLDPFRDGDGDGNTWDVDGNINTNDGDPTQANYRYIVWGCERPELVITETLAFHDCKTEDTADEPMMGAIPGATTTDPDPLVRDTDFDQKRRPQGSLFIELFAPWIPKLASNIDFPQEFKSQLDPSVTAIDLSRMAPASSDGHRRPVWQLVIGERPDLTNPLSTYHPQRSNLLNMSNTLTIEKIVWFTSEGLYGSKPNVTLGDNRIHYYHLNQWTPPGAMDIVDYENRVNFDDSGSAADNDIVNNMFLIRPGQYSVIGPRVRTTLWRSGVNQWPPDNVTNVNQDLVRIQLLDEQAGSPQPPDPSTAGTQVIGQLVSDTGGWDGVNFGAYVGNYPDAYYGGADNSHQIQPPRGIVINQPRALNISEKNNYAPTSTDPTKYNTDPDDPNIKYWDVYDPVLDTPEDPVTLQARSSNVPSHHKEAFLQRLANPLVAWDPDTNPYITVDHAPIELHVYNGETGAQDPAVGGNQNLQFASLERSGTNQDLWTNFNYSRHPSAGMPPAGSSDPNGYTGRLIHSLGYLNTRFWTSNSPRTITTGDGYSAGNLYVGAPRQAFPWLSWQNRPFISNMELLTVPASSPSRLLSEFGPGAGGGHLLDFFSSTSNVTTDDGGSGSWSNPANARGNLFRLLEFVHVPSRFAGSFQLLTPSHFTNCPNFAFRPPQNVVSMFQDPGRVNINTIFDDGDTWRALLNDFPGAFAHWDNVRRSRQGYTAGNIFTLNNDSPTYFANPFRSFASSGTVAVNELKFREADTSGTPRTMIESTLLRPNPSNPTLPLLAANGTFGNVNAASRDAAKNVFFRTEPMIRLGNNLTTHSNVYAVWITVGFFGVTPQSSGSQQPDRAISPDGYSLGSELGADIGDITRHRAFFIIDRSVPVGFRNRGENLNVEKAIVLRRFIE